MQHVVVDCVIHKAPDGFAGLRRLDAATRTWLKELTLIFERLANDYIIMLVFIINCHLEIQVQEHCKHSLENCVQCTIYQQVSSTGARSCFVCKHVFTLLAAKTISSISGKPEQRLEKA